MFALIQEFPNYSISLKGEVTNTTTGRVLKPSPDTDGYPQVVLCDAPRRKTCKVHRLVCLTFLPNPNKYPVVNHIDGDKTNNNVNNLEWCTISHNTKHAYKLGALCQKGENNNATRFSDQVVERVKEGYDGGNITAYAKELDMPYSVVYSYIKGLRREGSTTIRKEYNPSGLEAHDS